MMIVMGLSQRQGVNEMAGRLRVELKGTIFLPRHHFAVIARFRNTMLISFDNNWFSSSA
jgi:hypothetical protein